jgi:hypothetical protein
MNTTTHPPRQLTWTRMGNALGYTNTEAKRAEIRDAIEQMVWRDPGELPDVLTTAPARQVIASLFYGRAWALWRAAVVTLPAELAARDRRLIGLASVTGDRFVLLHAGVEVVDLLHDHAVGGLRGAGGPS